MFSKGITLLENFKMTLDRKTKLTVRDFPV